VTRTTVHKDASSEKECRIYGHGEFFCRPDDAIAAYPSARPVWRPSSATHASGVSIEFAQRTVDCGQHRDRGADAVIAWTFPDPATATYAQVEFTLVACETTLNENVDASADDDRAFFLSAVFAIAAVCRADLHCRLRDSGMAAELNQIIANADGAFIEDENPSD
jgi:hypothetical protein